MMDPFPAGSNEGAAAGVDLNTNEAVSVSMLELVTKQLEEKFERKMSLQREQFQKVEKSLREEVASLKRELEEDREQRGERGYYDDAIDILAEEMVRLELECAGLEKRVEKFEENNVQGRRQGAVVDFVSPPPVLVGEKVGVENSSLPNQLQLQKDKNGVDNNDDLGGRESMEENKSVDLSSDVEIEIMHGKSPTNGRKLPFLCLCGMEFETDGLLSEHMRRDGTASASPLPPAPILTRTSETVVFRNFDRTDQPSTSRAGQPEKSPVTQEVPSSSSSQMKKKHGSHPLEPLLCLCGKIYRDVPALEKHLRYYFMRNWFPCKVCGEGFPFRSVLKTHMNTAKGHGQRQGSSSMIPPTPQAPAQASVRPSPSAPIEGSRASQRGDRHRHAVGEKRVENGKPRFYCSCGRSYFQKWVLMNHIRGTSVGKVFQCQLCSLCFDKHDLLQGHVRRTHKATYWNKGKYVCSNCAGTSETMAKLREHRAATHQGE